MFFSSIPEEELVMFPLDSLNEALTAGDFLEEIFPVMAITL